MGGNGVDGATRAFSFSFAAKELIALATYLHPKNVFPAKN
jgi:hypothetical protein